MKTSTTNRALSLWLGLVSVLVLCVTPAWADTLTWWGTGAAPDWSDVNNWTNLASANAAPANGDALIFEASSPFPTPNNNLSGLAISSMTISNGNFDFTGNPLTIAAGITNWTGDNVFDLPLTMTANQTFEVDASSLTFNKGTTNGGFVLSYAGIGNINQYGQVSGTGSMVMNGSGTLLVTNRQPLTGGIIVNSGTLNFNIGGNLNFGGAETPSLITINTNGTVLSDGTHAIGGGTSIFINRGDWKLDAEDYKQNLTMWDGTIEPGPSPNGSGGQLRVGSAGGGGTWTWFVTNSITGSTISSPLSTIGSSVNLILNVARGLAASDLTISGVIISSGSITLTGNGITTFSGVNTHSGSLTINSGSKLILQNQLWSTPILVASNAVFDISSANMSLNTNQVLTGVGTVIGTLFDNNAGVSGAILSPGGNGAAGTLTMDGLNLTGNSLQLNFDLANNNAIGGGTNDLLVVTNFSAIAGSTNLVNISFLNGTPQTGVYYTLIKYYNGFSGDASQFLAASASRFVYTFTNDTTAGAIKVLITGTPANLVWRGDGVTNNWDINVTKDWINGVAFDAFLQGDNATFNDTGSNTPPVNLIGTLQPTVVTVNATKDYTLGGSGKISGGAKLVKSNSGNLTVLTANDNTGGGGLTGTGTLTVGNGGPTAANIGSGTFTNNTKVTFFENASATYAGNMIGTGSLVANMPGATLTLTGTNTFPGGTTIANGTLQIGNGAVASVAGPITNYGTLALFSTNAYTLANSITSAGNTLEYGNGDVQVRGQGGMTVDGTAGINTLPAGSLSIAQNAAGYMTVNSGAVINIGGSYLLGNQSGAGNFGVVTQNNGTITVGNQVRIGHWGSEVSTNVMNGGTLNVLNNQLAVGWDGIGLMTMNGGTVNCRSLTVDDNGFTAAINGLNSVFKMTGGQLNVGVNGIGGNTQTNTDVNNILLSGGTIAAMAPAGYSSSMSMVLTNGSPTFDSSNTTVTLSGVLSGNGGLTKQGAGYLILSGVNTYTNTTTVANGTLEGAGTIVGPLVVQNGANLSAGGTLATGTLTASNVTMNPGANLVIDASSTAATSDLLYAKGTLTLDAATPLIFNFLGGTPYTGGAYTVVSNLTARSGHLVYSNPTRYTAAVDESNGNRIQVSFSGTNASLVWKGNVNTNWNVNTDANWLKSGVADKYYQSDVVAFDDSSSVTNVNLAAVMTPANVTVDSTKNYTFYGNSISGITALTKSGTGKLTLLNNDTYTGLTTISGGTLQVGNGGTAGSLPSGGTVYDSSSLVFNRSDAVTFNGVISGPGTLTQAGSGTLLVTAAQNHSGGTTINPGGTIQLGNGNLADAGALGNGPVTNNGTVIMYRAGANLSVAAPYTGGGALVFQGTGNSGQSSWSLNATNTFTGPVTLNYSRIQSGLGAVSFGSPSSITVNPGSGLYVTATAASPTYNIPATIIGTGWQDGLGAIRMENGANWAGNITLAANSRIGVNNATTNTVSGTISGNYELETYGGNASAGLVLSPSVANSYNALRVSIGTAGAKTIAGNNNAIPNNIPLTMNGGTLWLNGFSKTFSSFLNLSSSSSIQNGSTTSPATVTLTPVLGSSTYSGTFADAAAAQPLYPLNVTFTQTPGQWTLNLSAGSANWTGNLTNNGGTITTGGTTGTAYLGANAANTSSRYIVGNNGAVFITGINNTLNGYAGNVVLNNSTWICNRYISMAANAGSITLNNAIMTGTNSTDGNYESWQLPSTMLVRGTTPSYMLGWGSSSAFDVQSGGTTFDVADVTGNANADLIVGGSGGTTFLHSPANTTSGGSMTKTGAGTMELDGANTYTGATTISQGTLALGASGTLLSTTINIAGGATFDVGAVSGGFTLPANAVLSGSGTVKGSVTDASSTSIRPGGTGVAGTLTITTNLTLNGSGNLTLDLSSSTGSGNDKIQVNGNLTLSSGTPTPVNFSFLNGAPALGTPYTLIQCNGTITGTAATALTNSALSRFTTTFSQTANAVQVTFTGFATNLVWTGTDPVVPATWDVATSTNWSDGTAGNVFYQNDAVRFDDTSVNTNVSMTVAVSPSSITFDGASSYKLDNGGYGNPGMITGYSTLTKKGSGTAAIHCENRAVGPVNVNEGILAYNGDSADNSYAGATVITVSNNAAFDFGSAADYIKTQPHTFVIQGSGPDGLGALRCQVPGLTYGIGTDAYISNLVLVADATIGGDQRWDIGPMAGSIINGQAHKLTIQGTNSGSLGLRAQIITNVASITISNPITWYESFDQTNPWTATTTNYVATGSSLGNYGARTINMPIVLNGATILNYGGGSPAVWTGGVVITNSSVFNNGAAQNFIGTITGPGAMWVNGGTSTLTLSNASTYAGGTLISNAPATVATSGSAAAGTAAIVVANANGLGSGPVTINGTAYGSLTTNASFFATNVLRALEFNVAGGGNVPNGIILPSSVITNVGIQGRDNSSVFTLSGQISGGFASLTNRFDSGTSGSIGVTRLANSGNNFLGTVYVPRGTLAITADGCLGNAANTLRLDQGVGAITTLQGLRFDAAGINVAHPIQLASGTAFDLFGDNNGDGVQDTVNNVTISGYMSGSGGIYVRGTNGTLTLSGLTNTYSGGFELQTPVTLQVSASTNLGTAYIALKGGSTFRYTGTGSETMTRILWSDGGGVAGGGTIDIPSSTASLTWNATGGTINQGLYKTGAGALTLASGAISGGFLNLNGGAMTVSTAISGSATYVQVNSGTLTLGGANTYNGSTLVNAGTLLMNGSLPAGNAVSVASGAALGGNGTINCPVAIQSGATLQPGAGGSAVGKLSVNSTLNLAGSTVMFISKTGTPTNSQVAGISTVVYGGTLNVTNLGGTYNLGDKFTLFSAANRVGSFSAINLPALPGTLYWTNLLAVDGSIQVWGPPPSGPGSIASSVSGSTLSLTWPSGQNWRLVSQTNSLSTGLNTNSAAWGTVPGYTDGSYSITMDPTKPTVFYKLIYP